MDEIYYRADEIASLLKMNVSTVRYRINALGIECCFIGRAKNDNPNNCKFYSIHQIELIRDWKEYIGPEFQVFESKMNY